MTNNLLSLGFGILAWLLGGTAALRGKFGGFSFSSLSLCAVSLTFQFFEIERRAYLGDFAAIDDTVGALSLVVTALVSVTLALNGIALLRSEKMK